MFKKYLKQQNSFKLAATEQEFDVYEWSYESRRKKILYKLQRIEIH